jgi:hypothetical protein
MAGGSTVDAVAVAGFGLTSGAALGVADAAIGSTPGLVDADSDLTSVPVFASTPDLVDVDLASATAGCASALVAAGSAVVSATGFDSTLVAGAVVD